MDEFVLPYNVMAKIICATKDSSKHGGPATHNSNAYRAHH